MKKPTLWFVALAVLSLLGWSFSHQGAQVQGSSAAPPGYYAVSHVVDGDTIVVNSSGHQETVRLIGYDTPEEKDPRKPVQCFAQAAAAKMQSLVGGKSVRLQADPADSDQDKYHRLLRYVYLADGTFVNQVMTEQGYGFAYTLFPNSKLDQFRAWEQEARQNNRGLWAACNVTTDGAKEQTVYK